MDKLLSLYRELFPKESVFPKLHFLEDHVVPFMRTWKMGLGFHGEHGAESIHKDFNQLDRVYSSVPSQLDRLHLKMTEHILKVHPQSRVNVPEIKRRKSQC